MKHAEFLETALSILDDYEHSPAVVKQLGMVDAVVVNGVHSYDVGECRQSLNIPVISQHTSDLEANVDSTDLTILNSAQLRHQALQQLLDGEYILPRVEAEEGQFWGGSLEGFDVEGLVLIDHALEDVAKLRKLELFKSVSSAFVLPASYNIWQARIALGEVMSDQDYRDYAAKIGDTILTAFSDDQTIFVTHKHTDECASQIRNFVSDKKFPRHVHGAGREVADQILLGLESDGVI